MSKVSKVERHKTILKIIKEGEVGRQEELVGALKRLGFKATQGTVSRDIKALGLQKLRTPEGKNIYAEGSLKPTEEMMMVLRRMVTGFVQEISRANNLVIVRTSPGTAQGVAAAIDQASLVEVLGTVAGDDTILIIAKDSKTGQILERKLGGV